MGDFRAIVHAHQGRAFRAALRVLGNRDDALDAAQDAFLALHVNLGSVQPTSVGTWLERVATNAAIDRLRRRRHESAGEPAQAEAPDPGPPAVTEAAEELQLLREAMQRLSQRQREVVTLRVVHQMPFDRIRAVLGISGGAAKTHFRRGVKALADLLHPGDVEQET